MEFKHEKDQQRVVAYDGETIAGLCTYEVNSDQFTITHTEVRENYQGQGLAKRIVLETIAVGKTLSQTIGATCNYAKKVLENGH